MKPTELDHLSSSEETQSPSVDSQGNDARNRSPSHSKVDGRGSAFKNEGLLSLRAFSFTSKGQKKSFINQLIFENEPLAAAQTNQFEDLQKHVVEIEKNFNDFLSVQKNSLTQFSSNRATIDELCTSVNKSAAFYSDHLKATIELALGHPVTVQNADEISQNSQTNSHVHDSFCLNRNANGNQNSVANTLQVCPSKAMQVDCDANHLSNLAFGFDTVDEPSSSSFTFSHSIWNQSYNSSTNSCSSEKSKVDSSSRERLPSEFPFFTDEFWNSNQNSNYSKKLKQKILASKQRKTQISFKSESSPATNSTQSAKVVKSSDGKVQIGGVPNLPLHSVKIEESKSLTTQPPISPPAVSRSTNKNKDLLKTQNLIRQVTLELYKNCSNNVNIVKILRSIKLKLDSNCEEAITILKDLKAGKLLSKDENIFIKKSLELFKF